MEQITDNFDLTTLAGIKSHAFKIIDKACIDGIFAGFEYDSKIFSMSISAQINWSNLMILPETSYPLNINTKDDNESISLTYANRAFFYGSALTHKNNHLQLANTRKSIVREFTTVQDVIDWLNVTF